MNENRKIPNDIILGEVCSLLSEGKKVKLPPKGKSMLPFIEENRDLLIIAPPEKLRKGDIVLARIGGLRYIMHRIIRIRDNQFWLMGDGNLYGCEQCGRKDIFGVVECKLRNDRIINLRSNKARVLAYGWRSILFLRRFTSKILFKLKQTLKQDEKNRRISDEKAWEGNDACGRKSGFDRF